METRKGVGVHVCLVLEHHVSVQMGGAEYQAHQLAEELSRRQGVRVTYLARTLPEASGSPYDIQKVGDPSGFRRRAVMFDAGMVWKSLRELQPDVIYQRAKQSYTAVCAHYAQRAGIPFVFHVANMPDADGRWFRQRLSANTPFDLLEVAAGNWGVRRASHVVVQTSQQAALLRRNFGRDPSALIRNFQPLPEALPGKRADGLRVLWVANIKEAKRPHLFLELAERFAERPGIEFWMVGRPASHRRISATMSAIKDSKYLRYFGELPLEGVNALMDEADVFVNTSSFEGFPNTFIQAWLRGAIVVSLDVDIDGGMEAAGIGYCTRSLTRLVEVIDRLSHSRELRRTISGRAFAHARREHSLSNLAQLADFIEEIGTAPAAAKCRCP